MVLFHICLTSFHISDFVVLVDEMPCEVRGMAALDGQLLLVGEFYFLFSLVTLLSISVTANGLYEINLMYVLTRAPCPLFKLLLCGAFFGLDVMGKASMFPIILTTTKTKHGCYLEMRGITDQFLSLS